MPGSEFSTAAGWQKIIFKLVENLLPGMIIFLKKFGTTLTGRQFGRESFAAFEPSLRGIKDNEKVEVDFEGVITFTPSWGDEFLSPLLDRFNDRVLLKNTGNPSVQASLKLLERVHKKEFKVEKSK